MVLQRAVMEIPCNIWSETYIVRIKSSYSPNSIKEKTVCSSVIVQSYELVTSEIDLKLFPISDSFMSVLLLCKPLIRTAFVHHQILHGQRSTNPQTFQFLSLPNPPLHASPNLREDHQFALFSRTVTCTYSSSYSKR